MHMGSMHKEQYKFAMYSFSTLENSTTLQKLETMTLMKVLFKIRCVGMLLGMVSQSEQDVSTTSLTYECIKDSESKQPFGT